MKRYYLDTNATTRLDSVVLQKMIPWLSEVGNPSSVHAEGRKTRAAIDLARDEAAAALKVKSTELIFTSGGTESNNLAILGLARSQKAKGKHVITSAGEHHAVLHAFDQLRKEGFEVTVIELNALGATPEKSVIEAMRPDTILVSLMTANNETGVKQPVRIVATECAKRKIYFHTDAVQSAGKENMPLDEPGITALSLAGHKIHGPQGVGALVLRSGVSIDSILYGGAQENQRRPGTENVAGIVGMAAALRLFANVDEEESRRQFLWIERLWEGIKDLPGIQRNGNPIERLSNTLSTSFAGLDGEMLLMKMDLAGLGVSSGSACMVGSVQASHVLKSMGVSEEIASATIRFSIDREIKNEDLDEIISRVRSAVLPV